MNIILSSIALVVLAATTVSGRPSPPKIDVTKLSLDSHNNDVFVA